MKKDSLIPCLRLLYLVLLAGGTLLMAAMLTPDVQHNLQSAFKGNNLVKQDSIQSNLTVTLAFFGG